MSSDNTRKAVRAADSAAGNRAINSNQMSNPGQFRMFCARIHGLIHF